jgi:oligopeptide transport system substrate-binding protein
MKRVYKVLGLILAVTLLIAPGALAGGTLNVQSDVEVVSLDSTIATDGFSFTVLAQCTEGLYSLAADGTPILAAAESVTVSDDGLTYTFTLRDETWSDGTALTANDFVFAWRHLVDPVTASEYNYIMGIAGVANATAVMNGEMALEDLGVKAVDDKTLEVTLSQPVPYFNSLMAFPSFFPINEAFFTACGDSYGTSPATILANGAFMISSYEPAALTIELVKNPTYWDAGAVSLDGVTFKVIKDSQQSMLVYESGDLDIALLSGDQIELYMDDPEFTVIPGGYLWYLTDNQTVSGIDNLNIRMALATSYDKDAIVNNILKDGSIAANFAVPTGFATGPDGTDFRDGTPTYLQCDKAKALEYWNAGLAELGVDSLSYSLIVEDAAPSPQIGEFLKSEWESALPGLTIELQVMPKKSRLQYIREGNYDISLTRWGPDYADPMTYLDLWTTTESTQKWSNAEYDAIIESAKTGELALDYVARWSALKDAEGILLNDAAIFPVYQKSDCRMIKSNVAGYEFHAVGNTIYKNVTKD